MAMPQRDDNIEQIRRLEGLIAYAEAHGEWDRLGQAQGAARPNVMKKKRTGSRKRFRPLGCSGCSGLGETYALRAKCSLKRCPER